MRVGPIDVSQPLTYNNPTQSEGHPDMTSTATLTASPVLDFEVTATTHANHFDFVVFDARSGQDLHVGGARTRSAAVLGAMGEIADRTPGRVYAIKAEGSWCVRVAGLWAPLPLTPAASQADVFAYCNDVIARGRFVEVVDLLKLVLAL